VKGYVYVMSNESMPGIVKIGRTTGRPGKRASELFTTGVPTPFRVEYAVHVADTVAAERAAHERFESYRVSSRREFFRVDSRDVVKYFRSRYRIRRYSIALRMLIGFAVMAGIVSAAAVGLVVLMKFV
jgi:hypothetical protein